jgi:hypothetical protein
LMDNDSAWDCDAKGRYHRRRPQPGTRRVAAQEIFICRAAGKPDPKPERRKKKTG